MAEAVLVAATRSPIGRAHKGSLTQVRGDDMAATVIRAALDQVPQLDPATATTSTSAARSRPVSRA
jgi:acetyl-CoA C-acetyltransferase